MRHTDAQKHTHTHTHTDIHTLTLIYMHRPTHTHTKAKDNRKKLVGKAQDNNSQGEMVDVSVTMAACKHETIALSYFLFVLQENQTTVSGRQVTQETNESH